jgi:RNA polymerase primary sigma factor
MSTQLVSSESTATFKTMPPLFRAAILNGLVDLVQVQLQKGADLSWRDERGRSPLMLAASRGHNTICQLLLDAGSDPSLRDIDGCDAGALAQAAGHAVTAQIIRQRISPPESDASEPESDFEVDVLSKADDSYADSEDPIELDAGDWQAIDEVVPPADDRSGIDFAERVQQGIVSHVALRLEQSWDDVPAALPQSIPKAVIPAVLGDDVLRPAFLRLINDALQAGRITRRLLCESIPPDHIEAEALIRAATTALEQVDVLIDSEDDLCLESGSEQDSEVSPLAVDEAFGFAELLLSPEQDALHQVVRSCETEILSHSSLLVHFRLLHEGRHQIAWSIAGDPDAVARVLARAADVDEGKYPIGSLTELKTAVGETYSSEVTASENDVDAIAGGDRAGDDRVVHHLSDDLLSKVKLLREIRDQRDALFESPNNLWRGRMTHTLLDLHLSWSFLEYLRANMCLDTRGGATDLRRGINKVRYARERITASNMRLAVWIAKRYRRYGLPLADLIQEGIIGLLRAIDRFDPSRGIKFSTYAVWWIRQAITRAIADQHRLIRLPVHLQETIRKITRTAIEFEYSHGREATDDEVAVLLEMETPHVARLRNIAATSFVSLDDPLDHADTVLTGSLIADRGAPDLGEVIIQNDMKRVADTLLNTLDRKEAVIIRLRFGLCGSPDHTLEEVGLLYGVTRERIRQIEKRALDKLRHGSRRKYLRGYE